MHVAVDQGTRILMKLKNKFKGINRESRKLKSRLCGQSVGYWRLNFHE
jgi:hypothetical protein